MISILVFFVSTKNRKLLFIFPEIHVILEKFFLQTRLLFLSCWPKFWAAFITERNTVIFYIIILQIFFKKRHSDYSTQFGLVFIFTFPCLFLWNGFFIWPTLTGKRLRKRNLLDSNISNSPPSSPLRLRRRKISIFIVLAHDLFTLTFLKDEKIYYRFKFKHSFRNYNWPRRHVYILLVCELWIIISLSCLISSLGASVT